MFDLIERVLSKSVGFCEIRIQDRTSRTVTVRNGMLQTANVTISAGVGIRVIRRGCWGFASTSKLDEENLISTLRQAEISALRMSEMTKKRLPELDTSKNTVLDWIPDKKSNSNLVSIDDKIKLALETEKIIKNSSKLISNSTTVFSELIDEKWIMTTEGVKVHFLLPKPQFYTMAVATKNGEMITSMQANGIMGGMEELFENQTAEQMAEKTAKLAVDKLSAPYAKGGMSTVVLSPAMVGILAHEAIGHTVEADFVMSGSAASGKIGKKVASEKITLADVGLNVMQTGYPAGTIPVDDEGVAVQDTIIIKDGIMNSYLHDRQSAAEFGVEPTGNSRAWSHSDTPLIRMRNTYIKPGTSTFEEIIESTKDGYYLVFPGGGQADANAEFMFGCDEVYEIKNGKLGRLVKSATISGEAFEVLKSVDMVGRDFDWDLGSGACGKGQPAKVDGGGPTIRCKAMIGGR